jgi:AraC-like DNA-binding protein
MSLSSISRELGVNRHTIERVVFSVKGVTFREYQQRLLIAAAKELLNRPSLSIKEIAFTLGYSHPQDFSHFFRKRLGTNPSEYRESLATFRPVSHD